MLKPDVFYIGYQKAASAFLRGFFTQHHQVYWDRKAYSYVINPTSVEHSDGERAEIEQAKVYISMSEALCKSLILNDSAIWPEIAFRKISWRDFTNMIAINPLGIAESMKHNCPDARVLMIIRNQVDWLKSNYIHFMGNLELKKRRFEDFCETTEGMVVLQAGMYDTTIETYFNVFGENNVKVLLFERLSTDYRGLMGELCDFLGIDFVEYDNVIVNKGKSLSHWLILRFLPFSSPLPVPELISTKIKKTLNRFPLRKEAIFSKEVRSLIRSYYAISNMRASYLLRCDLSQYGY